MRKASCIAVTGAVLPMVLAFSSFPESVLMGTDTTSAYRRLLSDDAAVLIPHVLLGLAVLLLIMRTRAGVVQALTWVSRHPGWVACTSTAVCSLLAVSALSRHPLAMDEYAPVFQARCFAHGTITGVYAPGSFHWLFFPKFLDLFFLASRDTGRVMEAYWPGFALVLAPFEVVGLGFLCNPILAGGSVLLISRCARALTDGDEVATGAAMVLLASSPAFLMNGASFYSMNAHLFANLAFTTLLLQPTPRRLVAAGAVGAWALSLHNPWPHLLFAWPWWLMVLRGNGAWRRAAALALGYIPLGLALVVGWYLLGRAVHGSERLTLGAAFTLPGWELARIRLQGLAKLVLWGPFALVPLAAYGAWCGRRQPRSWPWLAAALTTIVGYAFVPFDQGHGWGFRYFHSAYMTLPLLACLALPAPGPSESEPALLRAAGAWALGTLMLLLPFRAAQAASVVRESLANIVPTAPELECVHFLRPGPSYAQDLIRNGPRLDERELLLTDRGATQNAELLAATVPDARLWAQTQADHVFCAPSLAPLRQALAPSEPVR